jgi:ketosteroid isomerase-like protein
MIHSATAWAAWAPAVRDKGMDARRNTFVEAFRKSDEAALKAMYSEDALLLSFDGKAFRGSDVISQGMAMFSKQVDLELKPTRTATSGDLCYEAGTWRHLKKSSQIEVSGGTYVWIWKRGPKGDWTIETHSVTMRPSARD